MARWGGHLPVGVEHRSARLLASDGLELQQRRLWLLLQRRVESADRDHETGSFHPRAGKHVPAQANAVPVLDLAPLLLKSLVVHCDYIAVGV